MKCTGAEIIVKLLEIYGIEVIAGIPGSANLPLYNALYTSSIRHVLVRHEQAAGFFAQGMARSTGKAAVCLATSGPGATNLVTAIADAYLDSVPLIAITGQVPTQQLGTNAFQEIDTYEITKPITKKNFKIRSVGDLFSVIPLAFEIAESNRPGPVLIDIPKDIQQQTFEFEDWPSYSNTKTEPRLLPEQLEQAKLLIKESLRPIILVGAGLIESNAIKDLMLLSQTSAIPIVSTMRGLGSIAPDNPNYLGMIGMHGNKVANKLIEEADLVLALGARFNDRTTGKTDEFIQKARLIHVDIDPNEINKIKKAELGICCELGYFLKHLNPCIFTNARSKWSLRIQQVALENRSIRPKQLERFNPEELIKTVARNTPPESIVTTDVGQHQMWVAMHYPFSRPRSFLTSAGLGTMGFGLPAAMGASTACPTKKVVCFTGDGSLLMNIQELATLAELQLDVTILLFNNQGLGLVRQQQELFFDKKYIACDYTSTINFVALAQSFGIKAVDLSSQIDPIAALEDLLHLKGPLFVNIPIRPERNVYPMVPPGAANISMIE
jgi:acetolactate synthase I/II/III large subunit